MAFPASQQTLDDGLRQARNVAFGVKSTSQNALTLLAGTVNSDQIMALVDYLRGSISTLNADAAVPGIGAYAQAQFNNSTLNISTEFTNMMNAINGVVSWIATNFPKDTQGFMQGWTLNADGSRTPATFTTTQTAGLQTALNAVIASIS